MSTEKMAHAYTKRKEVYEPKSFYEFSLRLELSFWNAYHTFLKQKHVYCLKIKVLKTVTWHWTTNNKIQECHK